MASEASLEVKSLPSAEASLKPEPKLARYLVAFTDVLGFSALSESVDAPDNLAAFYEAQQLCLSAFDSADLEVRSFTDNTVVAVQLSQDDPALVSNFLTALGQYQLGMTERGFFVRGGIALGDAFFGPSFVFGAALITAYGLESKRAIWPRIVVAAEARSYVTDQLRTVGLGAQSFDADEVVVDWDDHLVVNYLSAAWDGGLVADHFSRHAKTVQLNLTVHAKAAALRPKFEWAARYHNWMCTLASEPGVEMIPEGLLQSAQERIELPK